MPAASGADAREVNRRRIGPILVTALAIAWACALAGPPAAGASHARVAHARTHARLRPAARSRRTHHGTRKASYRNSPSRPPRHALRAPPRDQRMRPSPTVHSARPAGARPRGRPAAAPTPTWRRPHGTSNASGPPSLCLVNRERAAHGEGALQANPRLEQAAQSHTESMAFGGYFEHVGPRGDTPVEPDARVGLHLQLARRL